MKKLSMTDNLFLMLETRQAMIHVGCVLLFELPTNYEGDFFADLINSFHNGQRTAEPFNQRLSYPLFKIGLPTWIDDKKFDIDFHLRHLALPNPGTMEQLNTIVSQLHGTMLDRNRPLWEYSLIEGVEGDRFAIYFKMHHSLFDGAAAMELIVSSLNNAPDDRTVRPLWQRKSKRWIHNKDQSLWVQWEKKASNLMQQAVSASELIRFLGKAGLMSSCLGEKTVPLPFSAPDTLFNKNITGQRCFANTNLSLAAVKKLGKAADATVNDIVLAVCAGALKRFLESHNDLPDTPLISIVPIALPSKSSDFSANRITAMQCSLGTHIDNPFERLKHIKASTAKNKALINPLSDTAKENIIFINQGPFLLTHILGLGDRMPRPASNLVISNVPGPRKSQYLNGARLEAMYPVSVVFNGQALNITVTSYEDILCFGLIACRSVVPDVDKLTIYLGEAFDEIENAVFSKTKASIEQIPKKKLSSVKAKRA